MSTSTSTNADNTNPNAWEKILGRAKMSKCITHPPASVKVTEALSRLAPVGTSGTAPGHIAPAGHVELGKRPRPLDTTVWTDIIFHRQGSEADLLTIARHGQQVLQALTAAARERRVRLHLQVAAGQHQGTSATEHDSSTGTAGARPVPQHVDLEDYSSVFDFVWPRLDEAGRDAWLAANPDWTPHP